MSTISCYDSTIPEYITHYINDCLKGHTTFRVYASEFRSYGKKINSFESLLTFNDNEFRHVEPSKNLYVNYRLDENLHSNEDFVTFYYNSTLQVPNEHFEYIELDTYDRILTFELSTKVTLEIMNELMNRQCNIKEPVIKKPEIPQININLYLL